MAAVGSSAHQVIPTAAASSTRASTVSPRARRRSLRASSAAFSRMLRKCSFRCDDHPLERSIGSAHREEGGARRKEKSDTNEDDDPVLRDHIERLEAVAALNDADCRDQSQQRGQAGLPLVGGGADASEFAFVERFQVVQFLQVSTCGGATRSELDGRRRRGPLPTGNAAARTRRNRRRRRVGSGARSTQGEGSPPGLQGRQCRSK
jgi:hypothetical protein